MDLVFSEKERLVAVELAIEAMAKHIDFQKAPPRPVTEKRLALLLPPMDVERREMQATRVEARMHQLLGLGLADG